MSSPATAPRATRPVTALVIGMAGSGKTTLMQRLGAHFDALPTDEERDAAYFMNMDPAVGTGELPYFANIDIRDTVNYKEVMKQYGLGPNGGIVTSLNLFATRFDQVLSYVERKRESLEYVFVDTPGQIEVFTWSASGAIITEALASTFPTVILYVVDTPRNLSPVTFMSNMMYACSIQFKTKLPFLVVFNKTDVASAAPLAEWMGDLDAFLDAIRGHDTYMSSLSRSMALVLDEFYRTLKHVSISAATGEGLEDLFTALAAAAEDYADVYLPIVEKRRAARESTEARLREERASHMRADMAKDKEEARAAGKLPKEDDGEEEEGEEVGDDDE